ncbi:DNA repair endonuclease, putative [Plasmodium vinckei brucechwatti]|uniref:DNA repair endonuclease, putative n=1 Tax=Plasmodium vinckei brucechwatti TaxID=119398 RepID=A0A6V7SCC4_PLAVN|nr:DNA repair endonuclease, putative [Plasmodium vinckei brucechwatti]
MYPLYYEKKIVKKLIQDDSLILLTDGFSELSILAIFIFYYQNNCLWYEQHINNENIFFKLFNLNIRKEIIDVEAIPEDPKSTDKINNENNVNEIRSITNISQNNNENGDIEPSKDNPKQGDDNFHYQNIHDTDKIGYPTIHINPNANKNKLIFILNVSPKEYNMFLKYQLSLYEGISKFDMSFNSSIKINYLKTEYIRNQKANERIEMYIKRGVYFISSNILLIDLLTYKIIPEIIDGIFICRSHKLMYSMKENFIIDLYRKRNKFGFIKGINNNKKLVKNQQISNISKKLYMKKIYCYPRFHKNIHISLNNKLIQPNIYEINIDLPIVLKKMEDNILNLIHYINIEIKKIHKFEDFDINSLLYSDNPENYTMNYIKNKNLTYNTKKLLKEIIILVNLLYNLYIYDDIIFYNYINNIKEADKEAIWMYCNEANELFYLANERKDMFLNKIDVNIESNALHTSPNKNAIHTIISMLQYKNKYFHKSNEIKREQNKIYNWVHDLVYNRDIPLSQYQKIILKTKNKKKKHTNNNFTKRKSNSFHDDFLLNKKNKHHINSDTDVSQEKIQLTQKNPNCSNPVRIKVEKDDESYTSFNNNRIKNISQINVKKEKEQNYIPAESHYVIDDSQSSEADSENCLEDKQTKSPTNSKIYQDISDNPSENAQSNNINISSITKANTNNNKNYEKQNQNSMKSKQNKTPETIEKVNYPIVIITDNFYTQKEIYNILAHKEEQNANINEIFIKSEDEIKEYYISDDLINSESSTSKSFEDNKDRLFCGNTSFHIPYKSIKNKTNNLKYIKPCIYIICINKNYEVMYSSENFVNKCFQKIDKINNDTKKGDIEEDTRNHLAICALENDESKSQKFKSDIRKNENANLFEINEFCGNLDFLELFLMKIKPYRIILTKLDLHIFRNIEIYCARIFKYNLYKLTKHKNFKELVMYEKNNLMYDNISPDKVVVKKEKQMDAKKNNTKGKQVNQDNYYTNKGIDKGAKNYELIKTMNDMCNTIEVYILFYKDNIFYNKYLNNIKNEKENWIDFIEHKNTLRFEIDRNVFNKNKEMFKSVIDSYFLFQKKLKENKKNIINFNKNLCEQFKNFQEVKANDVAADIVLYNNDANVNKNSTNFISIEEDELFLENLRKKINKKNNEITNLDDKKLLKMQEILKYYSIDSFNLNFILYSIFNNTKPIVIVDIRELKSDLSYKLYKSKMHIIPYSLLVGDYILTKDICVERKTIIDLIQSLNNNRLYNQINQMSKYYSIYVLLIEFNNKHLFYFASLNNKHSIYTKLVTISLQFPRLKILWSPFSLFTAKLFWSLKVNADQPDIFKSLHIDITLQKDAQNDYDITYEENELQLVDKIETQGNDSQNLEIENSEQLPQQPTNELLNDDNTSAHIVTNDHKEKPPSEDTYKYETINDLLDEKLNNAEKPNTSSTIKKMENVTNWNAIEILKALPGVTEKNMHKIINNVKSLYDLCEKSLDELENYMSKNNAKLLYNFLNADVS